MKEKIGYVISMVIWMLWAVGSIIVGFLMLGISTQLCVDKLSSTPDEEEDE
jgi:beta-lactamase regulating signal transducer with metallopeptidase domain